jgi:hypothetical protein
MSHTARNKVYRRCGLLSVPKAAKRSYRRSKKQQDKQALHRGDEPESDPRSDAWNYL